MKRLFPAITIFFIAALVAFFYFSPRSDEATVSPLSIIKPRPMDAYTIEALGQRDYEASPIIFDEAIATTSAYTAYHFHFVVDDKKVTGLAHVPIGPVPDGGFPVIVQFRGYVDREIYYTGMGTERSGQVFAANGFVTIAPDFLGYGGSDDPSGHIFEERFQTYTTALSTLASIGTLPMVDLDRVGIWGHSNGGQIALTILEAKRLTNPTTLWAPVTKPFPYSILYYTDELSDRGKLIRRELAKLEEDYDVDLYSVPQHVDRLSAPLQIHQGSLDDPVPQDWNDEFTALLDEAEVAHDYYVYPSADHNMIGSWNTVVQRDIQFFREAL